MTKEQKTANLVKGKKSVKRPVESVGQGPLAYYEEPDLRALQRAVPRPDMAGPSDISALQRTAGNRAVQRLLASCDKARQTQPSVREGRSAREDAYACPIDPLHGGVQPRAGTERVPAGVTKGGGHYGWEGYADAGAVEQGGRKNGQELSTGVATTLTVVMRAACDRLDHRGWDWGHPVVGARWYKEREGKHRGKWMPRRGEGDKPFGKWLFQNEPFGGRPKMNCWEAVLYAFYLDGQYEKIDVQDMVREQPLPPAWLGWITPKAGAAEKDDVVVFEGAAHVALATGRGSAADPEVVSLDTSDLVNGVQPVSMISEGKRAYKNPVWGPLP